MNTNGLDAHDQEVAKLAKEITLMVAKSIDDNGYTDVKDKTKLITAMVDCFATIKFINLQAMLLALAESHLKTYMTTVAYMIKEKGTKFLTAVVGASGIGEVRTIDADSKEEAIEKFASEIGKNRK